MTTVADILEERRVPEREEIAAMLAKYFVSPIADEVVAKLHAEVARVLADPPLHAGMSRSFEPGNGGRGFGCAWREEQAFGRTRPRSIDLAAWIAWSQPGYPASRPYCPDAYVGTWSERASAVRWTLDRDGTFAAPGSLFATCTRWCVHRQGAELYEASVWLTDDVGVRLERLNVKRLTPAELHLQPTSSALIQLER